MLLEHTLIHTLERFQSRTSSSKHWKLSAHLPSSEYRSWQPSHLKFPFSTSESLKAQNYFCIC